MHSRVLGALLVAAPATDEPPCRVSAAACMCVAKARWDHSCKLAWYAPRRDPATCAFSAKLAHFSFAPTGKVHVRLSFRRDTRPTEEEAGAQVRSAFLW